MDEVGECVEVVVLWKEGEGRAIHFRLPRGLRGGKKDEEAAFVCERVCVCYNKGGKGEVSGGVTIQTDLEFPFFVNKRNSINKRVNK